MYRYRKLVDSKERILKPSLYNFGASKIFVISDKNNVERRKAFDKAWSCFSDFDYEYVDAIMGTELSVSKQLEIEKLDTHFLCPNGCLSRNILGVYQSHYKIWEMIKEDSTLEDSLVLILEDDARPSNYFLSEAFQSGEFLNIINWLHKHRPHGFYWGRSRERITGTIFNDYINVPELSIDYGAHSYMLNSNIVDYLLDKGKRQNMAADVFIDYSFCKEIGGMYSPYYSFIRQESHILGQQWFPPGHKHSIYGSTTQPEWNRENIEERDFEGDYEHCTSEMKQYINQARKFNNDFGQDDWMEFEFKDGNDFPKQPNFL